MTKRISILILLVLSVFTANAQELNARVTVNADQIQRTNKQIFNDMQQSIAQFLNQRRWTSDKYQTKERIDCTFLLIIKNATTDQFTAQVQIQSQRPIYNSSYYSVCINQRDDDWAFEYRQFQNLEFNENTFTNDLTSLLAFYAYIIIGMDMDTYAPEGGTQMYLKAQTILNNAIDRPGWNQTAGQGSKNRYYFIANLLDERFKPMRNLYYEYHRLALDVMYDPKKQEDARKLIYKALTGLSELSRTMGNSMLFKVFFNAKVDELVNVFSQASPATKSKVQELLKKMDPANVDKYDKIK